MQIQKIEFWAARASPSLAKPRQILIDMIEALAELEIYDQKITTDGMSFPLPLPISENGKIAQSFIPKCFVDIVQSAENKMCEKLSFVFHDLLTLTTK